MKNFKNAASEVISELNALKQRVFTQKELRKALKESRDAWGKFLKNVPTEEFIQYLQDEKILDRRRFSHEKYAKEFIRYLYQDPTPYEVALSLKTGSYLSHGTAVLLHGINDQLPKTVYVNKEQSKKASGDGTLVQDAIDRAFANKQRESQFRLDYKEHEIVLLSGKNTANLQVQEINWDGYPLQVTSLERTLIDIAVRPNYAGGTSQVLEAYKGALAEASVNTIQAILKKLNYTYPYHQVVGFYLERAGFPDQKVQLIKEQFPITFDFYLEYAIPKDAREYSKEWRLFYPQGL